MTLCIVVGQVVSFRVRASRGSGHSEVVFRVRSPQSSAPRPAGLTNNINPRGHSDCCMGHIKQTYHHHKVISTPMDWTDPKTALLPSL